MRSLIKSNRLLWSAWRTQEYLWGAPWFPQSGTIIPIFYINLKLILVLLLIFFQFRIQDLHLVHKLTTYSSLGKSCKKVLMHCLNFWMWHTSWVERVGELFRSPQLSWMLWNYNSAPKKLQYVTSLKLVVLLFPQLVNQINTRFFFWNQINSHSGEI